MSARDAPDRVEGASRGAPLDPRRTLDSGGAGREGSRAPTIAVGNGASPDLALPPGPRHLTTFGLAIRCLPLGRNVNRGSAISVLAVVAQTGAPQCSGTGSVLSARRSP